jgi:PEP-CTERM motif
MTPTQMKKTYLSKILLSVTGMGCLLFLFATRLSAQTTQNPWLVYQTDFSTSRYYTDHGATVSGTYTYDQNSPNNVYYDDPLNPPVGGTGSGDWVNWVGNGEDHWNNSAQTIAGAPGGRGPGAVNYVSSYANFNYVMDFGGPGFNSVIQGDPTTYPLSQKNYLTYSLGETTKSIHFDSFFYFLEGKGANLTKPQDSFGWTVFNNAGNALMSINFNPTSVTGTTNQSYNITASTYGSDGVANQVLYKTGGSTFNPITNNVNVHIGFDIAGIGTANQSISVYNYANTFGVGGTGSLLGTTQIQGTNYSNIGGDGITDLALTWTLANNATHTYTNADSSTYVAYTNYGFNSIAVANLTVAIPEPKSLALLGVSGLIVVVALRRKKA